MSDFVNLRVDGIGDDQGVGIRRVLGDRLGEVAYDRGVGVEEVVTGHSRLARDTGRDDDDLGVLEGSCEVIGGVACYL